MSFKDHQEKDWAIRSRLQKYHLEKTTPDKDSSLENSKISLSYKFKCDIRQTEMHNMIPCQKGCNTAVTLLASKSLLLFEYASSILPFLHFITYANAELFIVGMCVCLN